MLTTKKLQALHSGLSGLLSQCKTLEQVSSITRNYMKDFEKSEGRDNIADSVCQLLGCRRALDILPRDCEQYSEFKDDVRIIIRQALDTSTLRVLSVLILGNAGGKRRKKLEKNLMSKLLEV